MKPERAFAVNIRRCEMEKLRENTDLKNDQLILKAYDDLEREKEKKFVNLIVEIIVAITLKEYYEKGDQIPTL